MLSIELSNEVIPFEGEQVLHGELRIDCFNEHFNAPISYWDRNKYLSQWKQGLNLILDGHSKSAFIATMYDPKTADFIFWWVMYRVGSNVYLQNHILFMDGLNEPFDENHFSKFVPERETVTEDGDAISEWKVSVEDIRGALDRLCNI